MDHPKLLAGVLFAAVFGGLMVAFSLLRTIERSDTVTRAGLSHARVARVSLVTALVVYIVWVLSELHDTSP